MIDFSSFSLVINYFLSPRRIYIFFFLNKHEIQSSWLDWEEKKDTWLKRALLSLNGRRHNIHKSLLIVINISILASRNFLFSR